MGGGRHIPSAPLSGSLDGHPLAGSTSELEAAARFLQDGSHFVVAAHRGPDGDAIGSILAMGGVLELMGKEVHRYCCDPVPYPYFFLEGADRCSRQLPDKGAWRIVLLDCSGLDRAGTSLGRFAKGLPLLIVDHHLPTGPQVQAQEQVIFSDQESAAVGMLVERLANALNVELTLGIAEAIYATVISDTGSFHYSNTSAAALRCCARMLEKGVDPWRVASHLYEAEPLARIKLLGEVLDTLETSTDGRCATLLVSRAMMQRWSADEDLLDGFINYGRRVNGVEIAVLFREVKADLFKCSMRSRGRANVAKIAALFGGGGHHNASGCHIRGDYTAVRKQIIAAVEEELARCMAC